MRPQRVASSAAPAVRIGTGVQLLFDDSVEHGTGPIALLGFALAIGGTVSLMRFAIEGRLASHP